MLTYSCEAWSSLARALSPAASRDRPTDTMKFKPILDFIEIGGLVSSPTIYIIYIIYAWGGGEGGDAEIASLRRRCREIASLTK